MIITYNKLHVELESSIHQPCFSCLHLSRVDGGDNMTIIDKFLSLPFDKQESVIDQLVEKVTSSDDANFCLKILAVNLGINGKLILDRVMLKLNTR